MQCDNFGTMPAQVGIGNRRGKKFLRTWRLGFSLYGAQDGKEALKKTPSAIFSKSDFSQKNPTNPGVRLSIKPAGNSYINKNLFLLGYQQMWSGITLLKSGEVSYLYGNGYFLMCIFKPCCSNTAHPVPSLLNFSRRRCKILGAGTSQGKSPALLISTLLAKGLPPTRHLEPVGCTTAPCPNIFLDIWELSSAGRSHSSPRNPRKSHMCTQDRQNVPWAGKQTTLLSCHWSFTEGS